MSLEWVKRHLSEAGKPGDQPLAERLNKRIQKHGDFPLPQPAASESEESRQLVPVTASAPAMLVPYRGSAIRLSEYAFVEKDPEFIHELLSRYWKTAASQIEDTVEVPKPEFSLEDVQKAERRGLAYFYMPPEYSSIEALPKLAEMFHFAQGPYTYKEGPYTYLGNKLHNLPSKNSEGGWMTIEWQDYAPFTNTSEHITRILLGEMKRDGQTFNTFIAASGYHKLLTNRFFDEERICRLLGTELDGRPLVVSSRPETGVIVVQDSKKIGRNVHPLVGARSIGAGVRYLRANLDQGVQTYPRASEDLINIDRAMTEVLGRIFRWPFGRRSK